MLTFLIILGLFAAASAVTIYLRRRNRSSEMPDRPLVRGAENFRSLFEPSKEELISAERELEQKRDAEKQREIYQETQVKAAVLEHLLKTWRAAPGKEKTIGLLYEAAKSENEHIYLKACNEVLQVWHAGSINDLSAADLAQLMESHFWLIPRDIRTPGVSFRINEEIAGLRSESVSKK